MGTIIVDDEIATNTKLAAVIRLSVESISSLRGDIDQAFERISEVVGCGCACISGLET